MTLPEGLLTKPRAITWPSSASWFLMISAETPVKAMPLRFVVLNSGVEQHLAYQREVVAALIDFDFVRGGLKQFNPFRAGIGLPQCDQIGAAIVTKAHDVCAVACVHVDQPPRQFAARVGEVEGAAAAHLLDGLQGWLVGHCRLWGGRLIACGLRRI